MYIVSTMMQYRAPMVDAALYIFNAKTCAKATPVNGLPSISYEEIMPCEEI